tara:strand:+ start:207 stop:554 length:348 start_codon:yes stop_codon:yes gene_type:complete
MRLTRKQVVDAIEAVMAQGCLSEDTAGSCYYERPDDPSINCVVGKLLTPEQRKVADATKSDTSIEWVNHEHGFFDEEDIHLLTDLQSAHDLASDLNHFEKEAQRVVKRYFDENTN